MLVDSSGWLLRDVIGMFPKSPRAFARAPDWSRFAGGLKQQVIQVMQATGLYGIIGAQAL